MDFKNWLNEWHEEFAKLYGNDDEFSADDSRKLGVDEDELHKKFDEGMSAKESAYDEYDALCCSD